MTSLALYDTETNGLLDGKWEKGTYTPPMDKMHCIAITFKDTVTGERRKISAANQPGYEEGHPATEATRGWERMTIERALQELEKAGMRVAHNALDFDEQAIPRVFPWFKPAGGVLDTLILSRAIFPDIAKSGPNKHKLLPHMRMRHTLQSWGVRLGLHKGEYTDWCKEQGFDPWAIWREEMQVYMERDVDLLEVLFNYLMATKPSTVMSAIEHEFATIIRRQERRGIAFDHPKALVLLGELTAREEALEAELIDDFGEWWVFGRAASGAAIREPVLGAEEDDEEGEDPEEQERRRKAWEAWKRWGEVVIPKAKRTVKLPGFPLIEITRLSKSTGKPLKPYTGPPQVTYAQGAPYTPIKRVQFNPKSRTHIYQRLIVKFGWEPSKFTKGGKKSPPQPQVDDAVLKGLPWPEAQKLAVYYLVLKRLGALAVGRKAWLKVARETEHPNGTKTYRIHGRVNTCGAVTGRCTHSDPNLAQVPKNTAAEDEPWDELHGTRCRELFIAAEPYELAGFDGSGLELRMLAHYVYEFDDGAYAKIVSEEDPHAWLRDLIGTDLIGEGDLGRNRSKTVNYAKLFGAGSEKLGAIIKPTATKAEKIAIGAEISGRMDARFTAKALLQAKIERKVQENGFLIGLDGRVLRIRKAHASLNTLLQSAGAVVMKKALILLDKRLQADGLTAGNDYEFVVNVHDEAQAELLPTLRPIYEKAALWCVPEAGRQLRVKCPLKAEAKFGHSWRATH